ncbi:uncharacterized protein LOC122327542 [Puntigrus tetrazona]|uniref:uncharacterized protein LOC122327542 n=1 Tax=Puntigrus tetrazona TaxID=1606681 RepID=UPI001C8A982B|nr:uncharacterized protein LOC122327542 [Puntigrus tetrazona]
MLEVFQVLSWLCFCHHAGVLADTDAVKSVSVTEGDSVALNITLTQIQKADQILWRFGENRSVIAKINREAGISNTPDIHDGRFRDRLKLDNQTGSLTITNTTGTDSGVYEVSIKNSSSEAQHRFSVTVYEVQNPPPDSSLQIVLTSAAVVGSLLTLAAVGIFCICKKHRKTDHEVQTHTEEITYVDQLFLKRNTQKAEVKQKDEVVYARVVRKVDRTAA